MAKLNSTYENSWQRVSDSLTRVEALMKQLYFLKFGEEWDEVQAAELKSRSDVERDTQDEDLRLGSVISLTSKSEEDEQEEINIGAVILEPEAEVTEASVDLRSEHLNDEQFGSYEVSDVHVSPCDMEVNDRRYSKVFNAGTTNLEMGTECVEDEVIIDCSNVEATQADDEQEEVKTVAMIQSNANWKILLESVGSTDVNVLAVPIEIDAKFGCVYDAHEVLDEWYDRDTITNSTKVTEMDWGNKKIKIMGEVIKLHIPCPVHLVLDYYFLVQNEVYVLLNLSWARLMIWKINGLLCVLIHDPGGFRCALNYFYNCKNYFHKLKDCSYLEMPSTCLRKCCTQTLKSHLWSMVLPILVISKSYVLLFYEEDYLLVIYELIYPHSNMNIGCEFELSMTLRLIRENLGCLVPIIISMANGVTEKQQSFGFEEIWFLVGALTCEINAATVSTCSKSKMLVLLGNSHLLTTSTMEMWAIQDLLIEKNFKSSTIMLFGSMLAIVAVNLYDINLGNVFNEVLFEKIADDYTNEMKRLRLWKIYVTHKSVNSLLLRSSSVQLAAKIYGSPNLLSTAPKTYKHEDSSLAWMALSVLDVFILDKEKENFSIARFKSFPFDPGGCWYSNLYWTDVSYTELNLEDKVVFEDWGIDMNQKKRSCPIEPKGRKATAQDEWAIYCTTMSPKQLEKSECARGSYWGLGIIIYKELLCLIWGR
ncbi:OKR_DC_1 domain-containing protein [Senna tora]|uniref:OKR_DC_1 domain-containing protein n=1 Tax=Senna tora TaxID=362788 RepID=A0A834XKG8_9FABA|nr:OKR_DC_1 domain-containing protein [Senna tora]